MVETCPLCDTETAAILDHVFYSHLKVWRPSGNHECWCGAVVYGDQAGLWWWADHVRKSGGLERHMLDCALGVK